MGDLQKVALDEKSMGVRHPQIYGCETPPDRSTVMAFYFIDIWHPTVIIRFVDHYSDDNRATFENSSLKVAHNKSRIKLNNAITFDCMPL